MKRWLIISSCLLIMLAYICWAIFRPIPALKPYVVYEPSLAFIPKQQVNLSGVGSQAIAVGDNGQTISNNSNLVRPTASTAKIMLALMVLNKYPLSIGQSGPEIPITGNDVTTQQMMSSNGQSTIAVKNGINLNEYQALQALLVASANNIAYKLAIWGFGSEAEYTKQANEYAKNIGMSQTTFADASGYSANTKSTASDMVTLSQKAMQNNIIAQIVNQKSVSLPIAGELQNTNTSLGANGINGIKTGYTNEAGGCLLYSANSIVPITGTIMGAPSRELALAEGPENIENIIDNIVIKKTIYKGQPVGYYKIPWGKNIEIIASNTLSIHTWKGESPKTDIIINELSATTKFNGQVKSSSSIQKNTAIKLELSENISRPSIVWRITHPI